MSIVWNSEPVIRVHVRRRVSVAVLVLDDFTGRPVTAADLKVSAAELLERPVRKGDGYFLFLDSPVPTLTITARAWAYHTATVQADLSALPPLRPVVRLRLTPNRNYSIPMQTTCLEGDALPGTQVRMFCLNDPKPLRLLYDYAVDGPEGGRQIQIYAPDGADLAGRHFALLRKGEEQAECFCVLDRLEETEGGCLLTAPLARDCKKAGATLLPVLSAAADEKGRYFLPMCSLAVKSYRCRVLWAPPGGSWREQTLELEPGRVTRLDLTAE
jgi:hypothetical protein